MADEPVYSLLQAIDPSKIKVPISERFSKLTLSSNKKQNKREEEDEEVAQQNIKSTREKRESASRNLLVQLSQDSFSPPRNPLLRSESSKDISDERSTSHAPETCETMDPLNVTDDDDDDYEDEEEEYSDAHSNGLRPQLDVVVDDLSQKISALDIISRPISLSSTCSSAEPAQHDPHEVTQLISTESQRSSMGEVRPFHNIVEIPVKTIYKKEVVSVTPKAKIQHQVTGNDYEMTEDEDDDEAITISDSSQSEVAEEDPSEMAMSATARGALAGLSPEKMERVAAFLRDVSMEQRNLAENGHTSMENFEYTENIPPREMETLVKARRIASADTESMTPDGDDEGEYDAIKKSLLERQERLKAFDSNHEDDEAKDTENLKEVDVHRLANDETQDNSIMTDLQFSPSQQRYEDIECNDKTPQNSARRIVSAETQDNTTNFDLEVFEQNFLITPRNDKRTPKKDAHRLINAETEENTILTEDLPNLSRQLHTPSKEKSKTSHITPRNNKETPKIEARRLIDAETEENTIMTEEEINLSRALHSPSKVFKTPAKGDHRRLALDETVENTELNLSTTSSSPERDNRNVRRLAHDDTEVNTEPSAPSSPDGRAKNMAEAETEMNTSLSAPSSPEIKNNKKNIAQADTEVDNSFIYEKKQNKKNIAEEDTVVDTSMFVPSSPEMKTPKKELQNSYESINSAISSSPINDTAPEHSITILETDDDEENPQKSPESNDNNKLSTSFHKDEYVESDVDRSDSDVYSDSDDEQMSQIQMSMANINISAKINIKIHIPDSTETSEDGGDSSDHRRSTIDSLPEQPQKRDSTRQSKATPSKGNKETKTLPKTEVVKQGKRTPCKNNKDGQSPPPNKPHDEECSSPADESCFIVEEDEEFVDVAQKLLNQLYGKSWQTPDVIRTLKRNSGSCEKNHTKTTTAAKDATPGTQPKTKEKEQKTTNNYKNQNSLKVTEESILGDFSMFRRNIVKTNLDSTRLVTPKSKSTKDSNRNKASCFTEPRNNRKPLTATPNQREEHQFKEPQTEVRRQRMRTPTVAKISANQIGSQKDRWRQLIDESETDSDGNNASDDDDADKSDESWKASDKEDSDFEMSPKKTKGKPKKNTNNRKDLAKIPAKQQQKNKQWRQLIDESASDSDGINASDDDDDADKSDESLKASGKGDSDFEISPEKTKGKSKKNTNNKKQETAKKPQPPAKVWKKYESPSENEIDEDDSNDSDFEIPKTKVTNKSKGKEKRTTNNNKTKNNSKTTQASQKKADNSQDDLVYLDLSKEEVSILEDVPASPPANHDVTFASRLNDILKTCRHEDKPKLPSSAQSTKTKRKLFTPMFGHDLEGDALPEIVEKENAKILANENESIILDIKTCPFDAQGRPKKLDVINKQLESVKLGKPIFQLTPPSTKKQSAATTPSRNRAEKNSETATPTSKSKAENKPKSVRKGEPKNWEDLCRTPDYKYSFLKSLDVTVSKAFCHPDALYYRDNYRTKKEDLSNILYEMYNKKLFSNKLDVPLAWNKKLSNTAGRCLNKKKLGVRSSVVELSEKVLTSADRLRCTLIHELCHAATWIFNGEGGHGRTWKEWANRANATFPEIPKIGVCHQYDIEYKYTYKCTLCGAKSHAHSKSKKVENIRCSYCHGAIEIFLNKKDKEGNIIPTPVKEPTGFAKFVKDNYKKYKREDTKHADVMKILSNEFATLKLNKN